MGLAIMTFNTCEDIPLNVLRLTTRAITALEKANVKTLAQLKNENIQTIQGFIGIGEKTLGEIIALRRLGLSGPNLSANIGEFLKIIRSLSKNWRALSNEDLLNLGAADILPVYLKEKNSLLEACRIVYSEVPPLGSSYSTINIFTSIARINECGSMRNLLNFLFRDFSDMEKEVLLRNYDRQQRCFADLGIENGQSRERIRQVYKNALQKWESPYQTQRQSGLYMKIHFIVHKHRRTWTVNNISAVLKKSFRGNKKYLKELIVLTLYGK